MGRRHLAAYQFHLHRHAPAAAPTFVAATTAAAPAAAATPAAIAAAKATLAAKERRNSAPKAAV